MAQYISFSHGRKTEEEEMFDWGEVGPIVGPVQLSWTYGNFKLHPLDWGRFYWLFTNKDKDFCEIDGMFYGDFEVWDENDSLLTKQRQSGRKVITLEEYAELTNQTI